MTSNLDLYNIIKVFVIAHFCLSTLAMLGHWLPFSYAWSQSFLIILGLWTIMSERKAEPLTMLSMGIVASIVLDAISIGVSWEYGSIVDKGSLHGFTGAMSIILLLVKPAYAFFTYRFACEQSGDSNSEFPAFGNWGGRTTQNTVVIEGAYTSYQG